MDKEVLQEARPTLLPNLIFHAGSQSGPRFWQARSVHHGPAEIAQHPGPILPFPTSLVRNHMKPILDEARPRSIVLLFLHLGKSCPILPPCFYDVMWTEPGGKKIIWCSWQSSNLLPPSSWLEGQLPWARFGAGLKKSCVDSHGGFDSVPSVIIKNKLNKPLLTSFFFSYELKGRRATLLQQPFQFN